MQLRDYQVNAKNAIQTEWKKGFKRTLVVMPTGCGKTIVFAKVAEDCVRNGERVLILAHRGELLEQAADKLSQATGLGCAVEKAEDTCLDSWYRVVVGSVQSLMRETRLVRFPVDYFNTIIVDEAHHCLADSYQRVLGHFDQAKVLGVTATADRGDMRNMGEYFESLAYQYTLPRAIKDGYLCKIKAQTIPLKLDLTGVGTQAGDFKTSDLGTALDPYLYQIAEEMTKYCFDRKTVVFLPLIKTSQKFRDILEAKGFRAAEVNGESQDRAEVLADFEAGKYDVLCNSMLLCLDMQTEILTDKGFVKHDEITMQHKVANWTMDGTVFFKEPKEIVIRPLGIDEHMTSIESRTINLRVTNTHRMVVSCGKGGKQWKKISAQDLRNGHKLPAFGIAEPLNIQIEQPKWPEITKRDIVRTAHYLRKTGQCDSIESSYKEARCRKEKRCNLQYTQPKDLSLDDCRFIGFWIADGSRNNPKSGGVEYTLCQSPNYPNIVEWIDNLVNRLGFDFIRKEKTKEPEAILWSLPRGTGSGQQERNGLFRLEPYLNKNGTELFWGLNEEQFDALIEGYWYGDGWHGQAEFGMPKSIMMNDTNYDWINLLCSIGPVRGWRCNMLPRPSKNPKHKDQWGLRMIKGQHLNISYKTPINQESYKNENVWCVRTSSKNIITRRNGHVAVMGNTEGWDCPPVDCIVVLRPTKIRSLYCLDTKTEVLTKTGWKTNVKTSELVASFDIETGEIKYTSAIATIKRPLEPDEFFCSISSPSIDIRVTNKHRMIYDHKRKTGWKIATAEHLANLTSGSYIPVSGHASFDGIPLSDAELRFIGWVMCDGSINHSNGQITITQGEHQPWIKEIQKCIDECGFKYNRFIRKRDSQYNSNSDSVVWTISKGKPRGRDRHLSGWGRLEPYLSKDLHENLFNMTEQQFDVMLHAIHLADGSKQKGQNWTRRSYHINTGNKVFAERLQIMAVLRGYKANVSEMFYNQNPLYIVHLKKQSMANIGSAYDNRPTWIKEEYTPEECWCVETELGTLVTRRNGKIAIVGNCQMVGRGTRLFDGKDNLLLLDFLWHTERHELCHPAHLICESPEVAEVMTKNIEEAGCPVDIEEAEAQATEDAVQAREEALANQLREMRNRKRKLVDPLQFEMSIQAEDLAGYVPAFGWEAGPPSANQIKSLEKLGIFPDEIDCAGKAGKLLDRLAVRRMEGLTTPKQIRFLEGKGFQHVGTWQFDTAKKLIDRIAGNSWRVPRDIVPHEYKPVEIEFFECVGR